MKYYIIILITLFSRNEMCVDKQKKDCKLNGFYNICNIQQINIDGCEYLYSQESNSSFLTHKGNCKNH